MYKKHLFSLSLTIIIVMLFSALGPTTVYADDGAPPDAPTTETDGASTEEEVAAELTEEEVAEAANEGEAERARKEPSLMEQIPDNTEVVVVNTKGKAEPLATQEAADAVVESDPMWCPAGVEPGGTGCTDSFSSFDALLSELENNASYQGAGIIYVEMGDYVTSESSINFNNYNLNNIIGFDLTIQGGWNTSDNTTGKTTGATTTFDIPIVIGSETNPWGGSLTLQNIIVSGVVDDVGLTVFSAGDVTILESEFTNNDVAGVFIDAGQNVRIEKTKVNDNGSNNWNVVDGKGLEIKSGGSVVLSDVEANDNQIFGADIDAGGPVTIGNSFFNGNLMYTTGWTDFYGYGLTVVALGDIALNNVEANENFLWGASLKGPNVDIANSFFNRNVTDSVSFIDDTGLIVVSAGRVNLENVEANENRLIGADIQAGGQISIINSTFNRNFGITVDDNGNEIYHGYGLQAVSDSGPIVLTDVEANNNYFFGANLETSGYVNISGSSFSNVFYGADIPEEQVEGLTVVSGDYVSLSEVAANNNRMFGADIFADNLSGFISVANSVFNNNQSGFGLNAETTGTFISLVNVTAMGNGGDGAVLETNCGIVDIEGGTYAGNVGYGLNVTNSFLQGTNTATFTPANGLLDYNIVNPAGCKFASPPKSSASPAYTSYMTVSQTEGQLPGALGAGNTFISALQLTFTSQANGNITLSFPIPAGMEDADLAVMFWDGSGWVDVPGGSVVGDQFVITVSQPGVYVLVSR